MINNNPRLASANKDTRGVWHKMNGESSPFSLSFFRVVDSVQHRHMRCRAKEDGESSPSGLSFFPGSSESPKSFSRVAEGSSGCFINNVLKNEHYIFIFYTCTYDGCTSWVDVR